MLGSTNGRGQTPMMPTKFKGDINSRNFYGMTADFYDRYDLEWSEACQRIRESGVDLSGIRIVKESKRD